MDLLIQKVADRMGEKRGAGHSPACKVKILMGELIFLGTSVLSVFVTASDKALSVTGLLYTT